MRAQLQPIADERLENETRAEFRGAEAYAEGGQAAVEGRGYARVVAIPPVPWGSRAWLSWPTWLASSGAFPAESGPRSRS
jgi:hypothetical protein